MTETWTRSLQLHELGRGPITLRLEPDLAERAQVAKNLGLEGLPALTADLTVRPWLDGVEITGTLDAVVEQLCSISLEPFEQHLRGEIAVHAVPQDSQLIASAERGDAAFDPDAPDPPDVLSGEAIDLAGYVVEHLALEIDPFPRKPGAEFDFTSPADEMSPFAVLKKLRDGEP